MSGDGAQKLQWIERNGDHSMVCFKGRLDPLGLRVEEKEKSKHDSERKLPVLYYTLELSGELIKIWLPSSYLDTS